MDAQLTKLSRKVSSFRNIVGFAVICMLAGGVGYSKVMQPSHTAATLTDHIKANQSAHDSLRLELNVGKSTTDSIFRSLDKVHRVLCADRALSVEQARECVR